jgi:pimeloyl-ACP methyl ester carboxylesterase
MFVEATTPAVRTEIVTKMLAAPAHVAVSAFEQTVGGTVWANGKTEVPVLVVNAPRPDRKARAYLETLFPRLEFHELPRAGHFLMMEFPEQFNRLLISFVKSQRK